MIYKCCSVAGEGSGDYACLSVYVLDDSEDFLYHERPMVIVCPGGAYRFTSDREAEAVAMQYVAGGYNAAVLRYSVAPYVYPAAILELGRSIKIIREHAHEWHVDPCKIVISGFSAGGHMVANYATSWHETWMAEKLGTDSDTIKPNGVILSYPVISSGEYAHTYSFEQLLGDKYDELKDSLSLEHNVNEYVPRTFIWSTYEDNIVPIMNSVLYAEALIKKKIPVELHIFEKGIHGLSLANKFTQDKNGYGIQEECQSWIDLAKVWLGNL